MREKLNTLIKGERVANDFLFFVLEGLFENSPMFQRRVFEPISEFSPERTAEFPPILNQKSPAVLSGLSSLFQYLRGIKMPGYFRTIPLGLSRRPHRQTCFFLPLRQSPGLDS